MALLSRRGMSIVARLFMLMRSRDLYRSGAAFAVALLSQRGTSIVVRFLCVCIAVGLLSRWGYCRARACLVPPTCEWTLLVEQRVPQGGGVYARQIFLHGIMKPSMGNICFQLFCFTLRGPHKVLRNPKGERSLSRGYRRLFSKRSRRTSRVL